jgi:predicted Rossmann fold flavoprotein
LVVGAGAAGLMAGIAAARRGARVRVLDGREKIGAKILVAGGGRCNVTNVKVDATRFHTENPDRSSKSFVARVLRSFSVEQTHRFFDEIGVPLKLEPEMGKYFPVSDSGRTVLNALLQELKNSGAQLVTGCLVSGIEYSNGLWKVCTARETLQTRAVVVCTGGLALPKSGSNGAGLEWARNLGHTIIATTPALTPLLSNYHLHNILSGVTLPAQLTLHSDASTQSKILARYSGSFLFTHTGYSGPVALNISRHVARDKKQFPGATVFLRLLPQVQDSETARWWHQFTGQRAKQNIINALGEILPRRVAEMICEYSKTSPQVLVGKLSSQDNTKLQTALFAFPLRIHGVADYTKAETTAGGVSLEEIESSSMMSKKYSGLFFAGEVCDVDGWLGGYNFQWAWSSGFVAGRGAAKFAQNKEE